MNSSSSLNRKSRRKRSCWHLCLALAISSVAHAASQWDQPAAQLTTQIAEILGAGQAQLVVNNRSTIADIEIPPIRHLLEQDLRSHGIALSGSESANLIRVTLSENTRERLWVAEVIQGNQTAVTMVHVDREALHTAAAESGMLLEKKRIWNSTDTPDPTGQSDSPVLAALETHSSLIILEQEQIIALTKIPSGWREEKRWNINQPRPLTRDPRGLLLSSSDSNGFLAIVSGRRCDGTYAASQDPSAPSAEWTVHCRESDDPWPIQSGQAQLHAFYNASRDYFTGVITPNPGVDLDSFYSIAVITRPNTGSPVLLMNAVNGKMQLLDGNAVKAVNGTRDWGSDFAVMHSACNSGTQIVASASGEALNDSLRAYELPALEAVALSAPLEMGGTVTALWTPQSPDTQGVLAIIRKSTKEYEVDRVTALCP